MRQNHAFGRAERHAQTNLASPLTHEIGQHAVDAGDGETQARAPTPDTSARRGKSSDARLSSFGEPAAPIDAPGPPTRSAGAGSPSAGNDDPTAAGAE